MRYQELIDFSVHPSDVNRFENKWEGLAQYIDEQKLDGIELLIGYQQPDNQIPKELVKTIHLPFWITWLDVWRSGEEAVKYYYPDIEPALLQYCCGGKNQTEMIATQKTLWEYASQFQARHAVVHAAHVELEHAFHRKFSYNNKEVCMALAELLNRTAQEFNQGEPPVCLAIENLWWPGMDLLHPAEVDDFAAQLEFENWNILLDTGHLMNTNCNLRCEDEAIDYILEKTTRLSKAIQNKIQSLHLNCSLSGEYVKNQMDKGLPDDWESISYSEKYSVARNHVLKIDQHLPFTTHRVKEIIAEIQPEIVVHEFITRTMDEFTDKMKLQRENLK